MRTPFKLRSSPAKGLSDFFKGLGKEETKKRQEKQRTQSKGEYEGMTDFEKRRAEKKSRKAGESKYQADIRRKREDRKAAEVVETVEAPETIEEATEEVSAYVPQEFKGEAGDKFRYRRVGAHKPSEIPDYEEGSTYGKFEFMDPDRPELKWIPAKPRVPGESAGPYNAIVDLYSKRQDEEGGLFDSPIEKKSPYKKGLGKYAKQAKGNRGYKMKRK